MIWLSVVSAPWSELDRTKGGLESLISGTVQMLHANAKSEHSNKAVANHKAIYITVNFHLIKRVHLFYCLFIIASWFFMDIKRTVSFFFYK